MTEKLQTAGIGVTLRHRDHRLDLDEARAAHGACALLFELAARGRLLAERGELIKRCEIGPRTERFVAGAVQHRHKQRIIGLKSLPGGEQLRRRSAVDTIVYVRAIDRDLQNVSFRARVDAGQDFASAG